MTITTEAPPRDVHRDGVDTPRRAATACFSLAVAFPLLGLVAALATWPQSSGYETPSPVTQAASVAIGITGALTGLMFWIVAVVLGWMAAMYEATTASPSRRPSPHPTG